MWAGIGLWDAANKRYLTPAGGTGTAASPAAFYNVAFRTNEPAQKPTEGTNVLQNAAWWRDRDQGTALAAGDITTMHADVSFKRLAQRGTGKPAVPRPGPVGRIPPSPLPPAPGAGLSPA